MLLLRRRFCGTAKDGDCCGTTDGNTGEDTSGAEDAADCRLLLLLLLLFPELLVVVVVVVVAFMRFAFLLLAALLTDFFVAMDEDARDESVSLISSSLSLLVLNQSARGRARPPLERIVMACLLSILG